jgi:hypothetical protein
MDLTLVPGTLPEGYCPPDLQHLYDDMFGLGSATFPDTCAPVIIGQTAPPPEDQGKPWVKTDGDNGVERLYTFNNLLGAWLAKHPIDAGSNERRLWVGDVAGLKWHDGGDGNDNTGQVASGAMWEVDTEFEGRSPMGPGLIPTSDPAKTLAVGENFGEGSHAIIEAETPQHDHVTSADSGSDLRLGLGNGGPLGGYNAVYPFPNTGTPPWAPHVATLTSKYGGDPSDPNGAAVPLNNVHPVRGAHVIKRTARVWYAA